MCDTFAAIQETADGRVVWFGKNSDREPGEEQLVEVIQGGRRNESRRKCTYLDVKQTSVVNAVILSRPSWMWGAEMGANDRGVVIGNEAVFTRLPYEKTGLTGMDLLRLALERAGSAEEAVESITENISEYGQGGACGYRNKKFRYHNSFLIADRQEAWVLETVGKFWALEKVRQRRTISNQLSIETDYTKLAPGTEDFARKAGWFKGGDFSFSAAFRDEKFSKMAGAAERAACTARSISEPELSLSRCFETLRDHNSQAPSEGWKMKMPCAHSSWWPTRSAGQTTGSMVSRLDSNKASHYLTGTSSPCLSVFKPVNFETEVTNIFWLHEKLHREVLMNYDERAAVFAAERRELERRNLDTTDGWKLHQQAIPHWLSLARGIPPSCVPGLAAFKRYWRKQNSLDGLVEEGVSGRT